MMSGSDDAVVSRDAIYRDFTGLTSAIELTLPETALPGFCVLRSASIKVKLFGGAAQTKSVLLPGLLLNLVILSSNNVPDPESGVKSFEKADIRSVRIGPAPGRTFPDTFQLPPVSPAFCTGSLWKLTTLSSKLKSPWKPTSLFLQSITEVVTAAVKLVLDSSMATS